MWSCRRRGAARGTRSPRCAPMGRGTRSARQIRHAEVLQRVGASMTTMTTILAKFSADHSTKLLLAIDVMDAKIHTVLDVSVQNNGSDRLRAAAILIMRSTLDVMCDPERNIQMGDAVEGRCGVSPGAWNAAGRQ